MNKFSSLLLLFLWMLAATAHAGTVTYVYTDPQGTPLAEADASGNITARFDYTPYGSPVASMGAAANGPGYTGHVNDPDTGLVYMQQRYFDPARGGFLTVDPIGPAPGNIYIFNRYAYANDNPINRIDPDGRSVTCDANSCTVEYHSVLEGAVDYTYVGGVILARLVQNAIAKSGSHTQPQSQDHGPSDGHVPVAPALPTGLVGDEPRATGKSGGKAIGTSLPSDKFADTVKELTGGTTGTPDSKGRSTSPNGVSVRTGGKNGPRIDIPANGTKPPEVIHFPDDTPIPDYLKPTPPAS